MTSHVFSRFLRTIATGSATGSIHRNILLDPSAVKVLTNISRAGDYTAKQLLMISLTVNSLVAIGCATSTTLYLNGEASKRAEKQMRDAREKYEKETRESEERLLQNEKDIALVKSQFAALQMQIRQSHRILYPLTHLPPGVSPGWGMKIRALDQE